MKDLPSSIAQLSTRVFIFEHSLCHCSTHSITVLEEYYQDKWEFYDLLMDLTNDENFKQAYIDNSFSKSFKKDFDHYTELANQAKKAVSKYFRDKNIDLRAFYVETNNSDKVLNINLINYNRSEPIRISDILQQERDISTFNIYCDKKHDIYAYRKDKERHYEFKEDAHYEMTSIWPVQDKHGKTFTCTMVMNVSSAGITEILQFNGKDFESPPKEFLELIRQNEELYIQGLSLHDAVKALLGKNKNAPTVSNLQNNEHIVINQEEKLKDSENDAKNNPILSLIGNNVSEINPQQIAAQAIATQTEVNSQQLDQKFTRLEQVEQKNAKLQAELTQKNEKLENISTELQGKIQELKNVHDDKEDLKKKLEVANAGKEELISGLRKMKKELDWLKEEKSHLKNDLDQLRSDNESIKKSKEERISDLEKKLLSSQEENQILSISIIKQEKSEQELMEAKQEIEELEKCNSDLQNELEEEKQENAKLQAELTQKDEELANIPIEAQELEDAYKEKEDLKKKLEIANAEQEKLKSKVNQLEEEANANEEEANSMRSKHDKSLKDSKSETQDLENKYNAHFEFCKQQIDQLKYKNEELKNKLELKDEQIKRQEEQLRQKIKDERLMNLKSQMQNLQSEHNTHLEPDEQEECELEWDGLILSLETKYEQIEKIRGQLRQEIEKEIMDECHTLESQFKEYENEIEILKEKIKDQAMEIERITEEIEKPNGKEPYLNNQDAERKSRSSSSDSAFYSDDDCCNSLLNLISSPSNVRSQSQLGNV